MSFLQEDNLEPTTLLSARQKLWPIPPEGELSAKIALVGEAGGEQEEREKRPFCGASGRELDKLLHETGLLRSDCYITNVVKERPLGNDISPYFNLKGKHPMVSEKGHWWMQQLKEELEQCQANVIVAIGGTALFALTGQLGILKRRGSVYESTLLPGRKIVPILHPRTLLGQTGAYLWRYFILFDLQRAVEESHYPELRLPPQELLIEQDFDSTLAFLAECRRHSIVDMDIEVLREEVSCIALTYDGITAISIPFVHEGGNYWTPDQEAEIWKSLAAILEDQAIVKRGQNFLFDISFLLRKHGIRTVNVVDTMVAQGILYPDFPKGLDFICSIHTRMPYYKDEGKKWSRITGQWSQHWKYNAKDVLATAQAFPSLISQLQEQKNLPTFYRQNGLLEPLSFMQQRGIRMDLEGMQSANVSVTKEIETLTEQFYRLCGEEINPNSPKQLMEYFYAKRGITPYKNRKTGADTVDALALKRLSRKGFREASTLLDIRHLTKLKGTYLDVTLDADGRLRCSFNPVGTETGRLSSGKTIFGTGTNLQNQPGEMKQFMLYDEGYVGYNGDLSQAENRIVAYVGPVPEMIAAFESGADVHSLTGGLIADMNPEIIKRQDDDQIKAPIGGGMYTWRFWGKKANHGLNYDLGYKSFALIYEIEERDSSFIVEKYHQAYPGVRQGFHEQVRAMLRAGRTVTNLLGRRRLFLDRWGDQLFKEAYAQIPQSSVADIMNERGINYTYYDLHDSFRLVEMLLQVHDSLMFQIPLAAGWKYHAAYLLSLKRSMETPLQWSTRKFVIPFDLEMSGGNMGKYSKKNTKGLKKIDVCDDVDLLAERLERQYGEMHGGV